MGFGFGAEGIEDDAGLNAGEFLAGVKLENLIHVLGEIEDDSDVAGLAGQACASAAGENRGTEFSTGGDGGDDVVGIARDHQANGNLTVVGGVGGKEGAAAAVEADFAVDGSLQFDFEFAGLREGVNGFGVGARRKWTSCIQIRISNTRTQYP